MSKHSAYSRARSKSKPSKRMFGFSLIEVLISLVLVGVLVGIGAVQYREFNNRQSVESAVLTIISALRDVQAKAQASLKPQVCIDNNWLLYSWESNYFNLASRCDGKGPCMRTEGFCLNGSTLVDSADYGEHTFYYLPSGTQFAGDGSSDDQLHFLPLSQGVVKNPADPSANDLPRRILVRTPHGPTNQSTIWGGVCVTSGGEIRNCGILKQQAQPDSSWCGC